MADARSCVGEITSQRVAPGTCYHREGRGNDTKPLPIKPGRAPGLLLLLPGTGTGGGTPGTCGALRPARCPATPLPLPATQRAPRGENAVRPTPRGARWLPASVPVWRLRVLL